MFQKQERLIAACLVSVSLALVSRTAQAQAPSAQPLKIGYGISQTGGLAPNGTSALLAQKIWEEDINIRGGLLGRPIKLIYQDTAGDENGAINAFQTLINQNNVVGIVGPTLSQQAFSAGHCPICSSGRSFA